jgi:hypothetical protein
VVNGAPGGGLSNVVDFVAVNSATPTVLALTAPSGPLVAPNGYAFNLSTTGAHPLTTVLFDGAPIPSLFFGSLLGAQSVSFTVFFGTVPVGGVHFVQLQNPGDGGGTGPAFPVVWNNPAPNITNVTPNSLAANTTPTSVTITGNQFNASSVVAVAGFPIPYVLINQGLITATIPAEFAQATGRPVLTVTNPQPGGGVDGFDLQVFGPVITSVTPQVIPVMTPSSAPITLSVAGAFSTPIVTSALVNGLPIPFTWVDFDLVTIEIGPSVPGVLAPGGFAVTIVTTPFGPGDLPIVSNAVGVTVGVPGSPDNAGTVSVLPRAPLPGEVFFLRVEAPVANQPVSLLLDFTQPAPVDLFLDPSFDLVAGVLFGTPFPLADGFGLLGPPSGATLRADDLSYAGVAGPRGVFDYRGLVAPLVPFGLTFHIQALYGDPSQPYLLNATFPNPQSL